MHNLLYGLSNCNQEPNLLEREKGYDIIEVEIYQTNKLNKIGKANVFICKQNYKFDYIENCQYQEKYLKTCLEGAANFGSLFLEEFKNTTYIKGQTISKLFG